MPDHVHGILWINLVGNGQTNPVGNGHARSLRGLPTVIGSYKSAVSKRIHELGVMEFQWQKSYHDRIIRSEDELNNIQQYILNNPVNWDNDEKISIVKESTVCKGAG
jgi:putative transposase